MFLKVILGLSGFLGLAYAVCMGGNNNSSHYANTLSEDRFTTGNYVYGVKYARFLSGLDSTNANDSWWQWSYFNRYRWAEIPKESGFYGMTHPNQLKLACKKAYEGRLDENKTIVRDSVNYGEEEVWKLCSSSAKGLVPMSIAEADKDVSIPQVHRTNLDDTMKSRLLSIHHPNNDWAWNMRQREFDIAKASGNFFASKSNGSYLKDKCRQAYAATLSGADKQDLIKWCGF